MIGVTDWLALLAGWRMDKGINRVAMLASNELFTR